MVEGERTGHPPPVEYGREEAASLDWDPEARERIGRIPAFVRGMVVRAVESYCARNRIPRVTVECLEQIRARMPTPQLFR